jgi:hypothetical protein
MQGGAAFTKKRGEILRSPLSLYTFVVNGFVVLCCDEPFRL